MAYYGSAVYGVDTYTSDIVNLPQTTCLYVGAESNNGHEANGVFDELQLFFVDKSDANITTLFNAIQASTFTVNHQILAHFDNNLEGGNSFVDNIIVATWRIFRKKSTENQYKLIATISSEITSTNDFETANNTNYDYAIEGISLTGEVTRKYEITNVQLDFQGICLIDKDTGSTFQFKYNIPETSINTEEDRVELKTFSKYPIIVRGEANFKRGSIQCLIINDTSSPHQQVQQLELLEGKDNLILKFETGEIYKADIYNISPTYYPDFDNEIADLKCDWVQVGEVT